MCSPNWLNPKAGAEEEEASKVVSMHWNALHPLIFPRTICSLKEEEEEEGAMIIMGQEEEGVTIRCRLV